MYVREDAFLTKYKILSSSLKLRNITYFPICHNKFSFQSEKHLDRTKFLSELVFTNDRNLNNIATENQ